MKVAFFGLPLAALLLQRDGHTIVRAAICREGAIGTRRLTRRLGSDAVRVKPDLADDATFDWLRAGEPDLLVSWFWTKRIPPRVLGLGGERSVGVHPSLLPRHRGPDPYFWTIDAGDAVTGVTAHALAEEYDTGAIYGARELAVDPAWTAWKLAKALDRPSLALLREVTRAFAAGRPPRAAPQDAAQATAAPEPDDATLEIAWQSPADAIERRVRAASPWPGAFTEIGDDVVTLTRVRPTKVFPRALEAGEAAVRRDGVAVVRCGDDAAVELLAGRDGNDAPLDAPALAARVAAARA